MEDKTVWSLNSPESSFAFGEERAQLGIRCDYNVSRGQIHFQAFAGIGRRRLLDAQLWRIKLHSHLILFPENLVKRHSDNRRRDPFSTFGEGDQDGSNI